MPHAMNIYTGSECLGDPGPGGYAVIIDHKQHVHTLAGRATNTTPQRLELLAIAEAVKAIPDGSTATVHMESPTLTNLITTNWNDPQLPKSWTTPETRHTNNHDLWKEIIRQSRGKFLSWAHTPPPCTNQHARACRKTALKQAHQARNDLIQIQLHQN